MAHTHIKAFVDEDTESWHQTTAQSYSDWGFGSLSIDHGLRQPKQPQAYDAFERAKTATRNGKIMTSLSEFTSLLATLGVEGPRHLRTLNLRDKATQIGEGSQFTVFQENVQSLRGSDLEKPSNVVIKRVKISRFHLNAEQDLAANDHYRAHLRSLELEVLSLGHPVLKNHRNVVNLLGWGYDYIDRQTPVPILFLEAALGSLAKLLSGNENFLLEPSHDVWNIKYSIGLDIAAGLQAMHSLNIIHGDVKPENVLVFKNDDPNVPYLAKLSDFGVCIDMQLPGYRYTPATYTGTPGWVGPEATGTEYQEAIFGPFSPDLLRNFDSYSFGLVLLCMFVTNDNTPPLSTKRERNQDDVEIAIDQVEQCETCPDIYKTVLRRALRKLLVLKPGNRALPAPSLLEIDCAAYHSWVQASVVSLQLAAGASPTSSRSNKGHEFWSNLDDDLLEQLDRQFTKSESFGDTTLFPPETLLGMAQAYARGTKKDYVEKVLKYLRAAASQNSIPAQAICSQVFNALDKEHLLPKSLVAKWLKKSVADGFLFCPKGVLSDLEHLQQRQEFRRNGGYCTDNFLLDADILEAVRNLGKLRAWTTFHSQDHKVDSEGNSMLHAAAALGELESLKLLLENGYLGESRNDRGETPLLKACQGGHSTCVMWFLQHTDPSESVDDSGITPLHWLWSFPEEHIPIIGRHLATMKYANLNRLVQPQRMAGAKVPHSLSCVHFPFSWPFGSALHWAAFARNMAAMRTLLELGAEIDSTFDEGQIATTSLAQAVYHGDAPVVGFLLQHGANALAKDQKGRSLLHIMSFGTGWQGRGRKFEHWVRHGSWEHHRQAASNIASLLLKAGVEMECRTETFDNATPLLQAGEWAYLEGHVICALLDAGADAEAAGTESAQTILHRWTGRDSRTLDYPDSYAEVMRAILDRTKDLNHRCGPTLETALHIVASAVAPQEQVRDAVRLIIHGRENPANINALDRDGLTPLMYAFQAGVNAAIRGGIFLEFGADPSITTSDGCNVISELVRNDRIPDQECCNLITKCLSHDSMGDDKRAALIRETNRETLARACYDGRIKTVELLLRLGMDKCLNSTVTSRFKTGFILDHAYWGAQEARLSYLWLVSTYATEQDRAKAEVGGMPYAANQYGFNSEGQSSPEVRREAYWAYPSLLRLLQSYGAERLPRNIPPKSTSSGYECDYEDAVRLPGFGFTPDTQPHREHWRPLYDLQILQDGWEDEAWQVTEAVYGDMGVPRPAVLEFDRWPRIASLLEATSDSWYPARLASLARVEVRVVDGKVAEIKDTHGKALDPLRR